MEIWKDVEGYVGYYQVSNNGRIRSIDRLVVHEDGTKRILKGKILKLFKEKNGYYSVCLRKKGQRKTHHVHRIVGKAFIENKENLPTINHKNEVKTDNRIENLEWVSYAYNINYGTALERMKRTRKEKDIGVGENHPNFGRLGKNSPTSKPILQYDLKGNFIAEYEGTMCVERELGFRNGNISAAARGILKKSYGYIWRYKHDKAI